MFDRVVWESRHKFIYFDENSINSLRDLGNKYFAKLNSEEPIVIYMYDDGLPNPLDDTIINKDIIMMFHERYYELLIFLSIVDVLIKDIDNNELNEYLIRLFKLFNYCGNSKISDINNLREMLVNSINMYRDAYIEYITNGNFREFYNMVPIQFVMIDNMLSILKDKIGLRKYFSVMLELGSDISIYNARAINNYISSRCNGYLSMNILLHSNAEWKSYYANNGQFIENVHDYTVVEFRNIKKREKIIQS